MPQAHGSHNPPGLHINIQENVVNDSIPHTFDPMSDMLEIGLMAAASPEFMDVLAGALLTASHADASPAPKLKFRQAQSITLLGVATTGV